MKGEVYGIDGFHHKISQLISKVTKLTAHVRGKKSESYNNQAGCPLGIVQLAARGGE